VSDKKTVVTLRTVADRVGLAPCSVSAVLNGTPASMAIPQPTRDRVFRAAAELNYQPNFSARSLRTKRTHIVAVVSNDFGQSAVGQVVAAMERTLRRRGYLLALGAIDRPSEWASLSAQLHQRGIEGVVAVGASLPRELELPSVSVHFGDLNLQQPMAADSGSRLSELGESAAEAILSKIENPTVPTAAAKAAPRRTRIFPQLAFSPVTSAGEEPLAARQTA
jgi:hypothetical protein